MQPTWLELLQKLGVGFIVRRLLEWGGGAILTYGVTQEELTFIVAGIIATVVGFVWSWIQTKWLAGQTPESFKK